MSFRKVLFRTFSVARQEPTRNNGTDREQASFQRVANSIQMLLREIPERSG
jgi:hypothetical protein